MTPEQLAKAIHEELRDTEWQAWLRGGNEAHAFNPSTGWCQCVRHAKAILQRIEENQPRDSHYDIPHRCPEDCPSGLLT